MRYEEIADKKNCIIMIKSSTFDETGYKNVLECKPHFHAAKEFLFVAEGEQSVVISSEGEELTAGDIIFSDSFSLHHYDRSDAEGYVLLIPKAYFSYFDEIVQGKTLRMLMNDKEKNKQLFALVGEWYESKREPLQDVAYAYRLLSEMVRIYGVEAQMKHDQDNIVRQMLEYVESNYKNDLDLESMASHIGYSKVYCSKLWNRYIKENFRDYVNRCRVSHINETLLAKRGKKSILQIAFENGFNSQSTFYRAYKKIYGTLPTKLN